MTGQSACRICGRGFAPRRGAPMRYCARCRKEAARESTRVLGVKCGECGKRFSTTSRVVRYCSDPCRKKGYARHRVSRQRPRQESGGAKKCRTCGRAFAPGGETGRLLVYCSVACRDKGVLAGNRERLRRYLADPKKRAIHTARCNAAAAAARRRAKKKGGR